MCCEVSDLLKKFGAKFDTEESRHEFISEIHSYMKESRNMVIRNAEAFEAAAYQNGRESVEKEDEKCMHCGAHELAPSCFHAEDCLLGQLKASRLRFHLTEKGLEEYKRNSGIKSVANYVDGEGILI